MDEVQVERLIQRFKESGEMACGNPALLMLKKWPVSKKYNDNPDKLPGLEQKVYICTFLLVFTNYSSLFCAQSVRKVLDLRRKSVGLQDSMHFVNDT